MSNAAKVEQCLDTLTDALGGMATDMLRLDGCTLVSKGPEVASNLCGAYLPILADDISLYVGVLADPTGSDTLAKRLLYMEDEESISSEDKADAMGEIANMLGGVTQRTMGVSAKLGLPVFVEGTVLPGNHLKQLAAQVKIGDVPATLVLLHGPPSQANAGLFDNARRSA